MDKTAVRLIAKAASASMLLYATYRVINCPCNTLIACHMNDFLFAYIGAGATLGLQNLIQTQT